MSCQARDCLSSLSRAAQVRVRLSHPSRLSAKAFCGTSPGFIGELLEGKYWNPPCGRRCWGKRAVPVPAGGSVLFPPGPGGHWHQTCLRAPPTCSQPGRPSLSPPAPASHQPAFCLWTCPVPTFHAKGILQGAAFGIWLLTSQDAFQVHPHGVTCQCLPLK